MVPQAKRGGMGDAANKYKRLRQFVNPFLLSKTGFRLGSDGPDLVDLLVKVTRILHNSFDFYNF